MPHFCATVKLLVEDRDVDDARRTIAEGMQFLKNEQNVIIDWGFSLDIPSNKGPHPRLVDPRLAGLYEQGLEAESDAKNEETKEKIREENAEIFKKM